MAPGRERCIGRPARDVVPAAKGAAFLSHGVVPGRTGQGRGHCPQGSREGPWPVFPTGPKRAGRSVFGTRGSPLCRPPKCLASSHNPLSWVGRLTVATWLWRERRCPLVSSGTGSGQGEGGPSTTAKGTSRAPFRPGKPLPSRSSSRPESPACLVLSDVSSRPSGARGHGKPGASQSVFNRALEAVTKPLRRWFGMLKVRAATAHPKG